MQRRLASGIAIAALGACLVWAFLAWPSDDEVPPVPAQLADDADRQARAWVPLTPREGERRETTGTVPHVQLGAEPVAELDAELRRRAFLLPGVEDLPSDRSLPGARGLALDTDLLTRPDVISGSREFAHIHPDGSLHVWLPVERAVEVHETKWGEIHPWADRDGFWGGVVMVFTPESQAELDVTIRVLVDAYNFVTGDQIDPADIA